MKKAAVLSILLVAVQLAVAVIAEAQQPKKVSRIGYVSSGTAASESHRAEGIRLALRDLGYIEGPRTSPSSTDMGRGRSIGPLSLRWSLCV
jgi:hypothetical protein